MEISNVEDNKKHKIMSYDAVVYTVERLLSIANPLNNIHYKVIFTNHSQVTLVINDLCKLIFNLVSDEDWYKLIERGDEIDWILSSSNKYKIPLIFNSEKGKPFSIKEGETIFVYGDIISSSFFMLSRWEETLDQSTDEHQRNKYANSIAYKYGFIDIPIVDEYAFLLRNMLQSLFPEHDFGKNSFTVKISHDIDKIQRFPNLRESLRTLGVDLLKHRNTIVFLKSIKDYFKSLRNYIFDPFIVAIYMLADLSLKYKIDSAFYFKTAEASAFDSGYDIELVKEVLLYLTNQGFEIGFHPGYYTYQNYERFIYERAKLESLINCKLKGGRQHVLRFDLNTTYHYWANAGMIYDSSMGYAEREGFRCGTCHPFKPYDLKNNRIIDILEIPLIVIADNTLKNRRNFTAEQALNKIIMLANNCYRVEGVFTLLWHNTSIGYGWNLWYENVYIEALKILSKMIHDSIDP